MDIGPQFWSPTRVENLGLISVSVCKIVVKKLASF